MEAEWKEEADSTTLTTRRSTSTTTSNLIECPVCGQLSSQPYHNYGAKVCFSCRAFFRRCHQKSKQRPKFVCKRNTDACVINVNTRRHCQKCRYELCVQVGMRAENVMDENAKRLHFRRYLEPSASGKKRSSRSSTSDSTTKCQPTTKKPKRNVDPFLFNIVERALSSSPPFSSRSCVKDPVSSSCSSTSTQLPRLPVFGFKTEELSSSSNLESDPLFTEELECVSTSSSLQHLVQHFDQLMSEHEEQWLLQIHSEVHQCRSEVGLGDLVLVELVHHMSGVSESSDPRRMLAAILQNMHDRSHLLLQRQDNNTDSNIKMCVWQSVAFEVGNLTLLQPQTQLRTLTTSKMDQMLLKSLTHSASFLNPIDCVALLNDESQKVFRKDDMAKHIDALASFLRDQDESTRSLLHLSVLSSSCWASGLLYRCSSRLAAILRRRRGSQAFKELWSSWTRVMEEHLGPLAAILEDVVITQCVEDALLLMRTAEDNTWPTLVS